MHTVSSLPAAPNKGERLPTLHGAQPALERQTGSYEEGSWTRVEVLIHAAHSLSLASGAAGCQLASSTWAACARCYRCTFQGTSRDSLAALAWQWVEGRDLIRATAHRVMAVVAHLLMHAPRLLGILLRGTGAWTLLAAAWHALQHFDKNTGGVKRHANRDTKSGCSRILARCPSGHAAARFVLANTLTSQKKRLAGALPTL